MTLKVLIVDDSEVAAEFLRRLIDEAPDLQVVGVAKAVDAVLDRGLHRAADVVVLDLFMPGRTGLGAIRPVAAERPVIVVSDVDETSRLAREAVAQGAAAFVPKKLLAEARGAVRLRSVIRAVGRKGRVKPPSAVVLVVGSTGAMDHLAKVLIGLRDTESAVVVVQHMPKGREESFVSWVRSLGVSANVAAHASVLRPSEVVVAPPDRHLVVGRGLRVALHESPPVEGHRPSGTVLLGGAKHLGKKAIVVILSGMGRDGADALPELVDAGATCLALDPRDCAVGSMPQAALAASARVRAVRAGDLAASVANAVWRVSHD
jgi:two-component system chemotaxis response regulator CheB